MKKERNLIILLFTILFAASCTMGSPDQSQWLRGKTFRGEVTLTTTDKEPKQQEWMLKLDNSCHMIPEQFLTVKKDLSYSLKDNVLKFSQTIQYEDQEFTCTREITVEKLPDRKIKFHEHQVINGTNQELVREGILYEMM